MSSNATIILIRHAEKHHWDRGQNPSELSIATYQDDHHLSTKGYERAQALVAYFNHRQEIIDAIGNGITHIIAQAVDSGPDPFGQSERPVSAETVAPFANSKNIPLTKYTKRQLTEAVAFMKSQPASQIIVCWAHQQLPEMARMLGVPASKVPEKWPGKRYDETWIIKLGNNDSQPSTLAQYPQRLLFGDFDEIIPLKKRKDNITTLDEN
ncbi:hypothetical protein SmJEL517_g02665 [Synchytrium microbalum]|uniref:Phosphoglycerate mutase n=1 Tax=Synchytrium microbalum TaxID=1806994 RepID=A0A507C9H3_9FUNG|nr:uncharacterized protein SmJEL517_g02665 [Synchytrium microbalum]TPX34636.1 hypothetical protein SmJEL517_g02665 [Synchytrium microbalum]